MNKKYKWTWNLDCPNIISVEEMENPLCLLASCEIVQNRDDSIVFKRNGFFFKWYKCNFKYAWRKWRYTLKSRACRDYQQTKLCQNAGLPVFAVVGYGQCGYADSIIISKELVDYVTVTSAIKNKFLQNKFNDGEFFSAFGQFLKKCFRSGIYFPDIHTDNIMYSEKNHDFILIDVYGARRMWFFSNRKYIRMCHSILYRIMPYVTVETFYSLMLCFGKCNDLNDFVYFFASWQKYFTDYNRKQTQK